MPCNVRCRCGKNEKHFQFLNEGDITHFDCDECPPVEEMSNEEAQELVNSGEAEIPSEVIEKTEETPAQRKKREKAERKAREAAEKAAKEQKAE